MVRLALCVEVPTFAEILANVVAVTAVVLIVNVAVDDPPATVTDAGTTALTLVEVKPITIPEEGATPDKVTVPVDWFPPTTVEGASETADTVGAVIVNVAGI